MPTEKQVIEALSRVNDPELHRSLAELNMLREVQVQDGRVEVTIALTTPNCPMKEKIEADIVTTPQSLSTMIVRKAVHMAQHVGVPVVGVVENMAYFVCPDTGKRHQIFGPSHADDVAELAGAPVLARLPINPQVAALCDAGKVEAVMLSEVTALLKAFLNEVPARVNQPVW